jgi:hypothetical protein
MPAEAQAMQLETMPPPVREMWLNGGSESFAQFVAELRR